MIVERLDHSVLTPGPQLAGTLGELMLASQVRYAERTALVVDGCAFSYGELVERAACFSYALEVHGRAGAYRRCAILGARSLTAFAGLLGALLARTTYVPLNSRHPVDRLAAVLAAAEVDAIVVDNQSTDLARELLYRSQRNMLVVIDAPNLPDWAVALRQHQFLCQRDLELCHIDRANKGDREDGAYLLFTSGSTGAPKGVLVRNRNIMSYLRSVAARYAPQPDDRFTQLFDLTFDLSVHDMFVCWGAGAALYCVPERLRLAPREFVRRHALTFWFSVPSTAMLMSRLHMLHPGDLPSLRWSLFCGEAFPRNVAQRWAEAAPNSSIENLYGPTEATVAITAYRLPSQRTDFMRVPDIVPIGSPLPGQSALVIGAAGGIVSDGEQGELCVGGSQITDGYWHEPDLTAERFAPPAGASAAMQWYRTGDRVKMSPDFGLLFMGRMDREVKVAGHRVDLQEVEAVLRRAAGCDTAAVIAWPVEANGLARGLVAFVTEEAEATNLILDACRQALPSYMVPACVRRVRDWPTNSNGKIDYAGLRSMME